MVLLVKFSAAANDDPSVLGIRDLEAARGVRLPNNTDELYIKLDKDPSGTPAAHFHRTKGDIRAEYHALDGKTTANTTYFIGYVFSVGEIEESLMIWQFKEYEANTHGGANIPLSLEIHSNILHFQYQSSGTTKRVGQWSVPVTKNTTYRIGIVINTAKPSGWVQLYWDGQMQKFSSGEDKLVANTFPGRAEPKFGAYRGEEVEIDTWVYEVRIGMSLADISEVVGIKGS